MPRSNIARPLPPVEYLRTCLTYDPESGVLTWKRRPREHYKSGRSWRYAQRFTGKVAGGSDCKGYQCIRIDENVYKAHRIAWAMHYGEEPTQAIDHRNGNKGDNSISNLREVTHVENSRKQSLKSSNSSGINGVSWRKDSKNWKAYIFVAGRLLSLGSFNTKEEAARARKSADVKYGYSPLHGDINSTDTPVYSAGLPSVSNSSSMTGVSFSRAEQTWKAFIRAGGDHEHLGTFSTFEGAAAARLAAEEKYGVTNSRGRVRVSAQPNQ